MADIETVQEETVETPITPMADTIPAAERKEVFTRIEVEDLLTKARREEKDKLYSDLDRARQDATEATKRLRELEGKVTPTAQDNKEAEELRTKVEALQKTLDEQQTKFSEVLDTALEKQNQAHELRLKNEKIATLKATLIEGAKGEVIPELVTGNSEEEVRKSFEASQTRYKEITAATVERVKKEAEEATRGALPKPVTPGSPNGGTADPDISPDNLRNISDEDWKTRKQSIKAKAFEAAGLPMKVTR